MDVQNGHATVTVNVSNEYDIHARPTLQEAQVVAFPASLSQMMKLTGPQRTDFEDSGGGKRWR